MKLEIFESAQKDFACGFAHYESEQFGLGEAFRKEIQKQIQKIMAFPSAGILLRENIRKSIGQRFPYNIIYWLNNETIAIVAISHKRQHPDMWRNRV